MITNGIYRTESAVSPSGPWTAIATLTNKTSINLGEFKLMTNGGFFRVAWLNPPVIFGYSGFDQHGVLALTGSLSFDSLDEGIITGTWCLHTTPNVTTYPPWRAGKGQLLGTRSNTNLIVALHPYRDHGDRLSGTLAGPPGGQTFIPDSYSGKWDLGGFLWTPPGYFQAIRQ